MEKESKPGGLELVIYRIGQMEKQIETLVTTIPEKLDQILKLHIDVSGKLISHDTIIQNLKEQAGVTTSKVESLEKDLVRFRISIAEKIVPGAITGGIVSLLAELLKYIGGI